MAAHKPLGSWFQRNCEGKPAAAGSLALLRLALFADRKQSKFYAKATYGLPRNSICFYINVYANPIAEISTEATKNTACNMLLVDELSPDSY
jgi:hypothetical protein